MTHTSSFFALRSGALEPLLGNLPRRPYAATLKKRLR
jgi:hypothetical protein